MIKAWSGLALPLDLICPSSTSCNVASHQLGTLRKETSVCKYVQVSLSSASRGVHPGPGLPFAWPRPSSPSLRPPKGGNRRNPLPFQSLRNAVAFYRLAVACSRALGNLSSHVAATVATRWTAKGCDWHRNSPQASACVPHGETAACGTSRKNGQGIVFSTLPAASAVRPACKPGHTM